MKYQNVAFTVQVSCWSPQLFLSSSWVRKVVEMMPLHSALIQYRATEGEIVQPWIGLESLFIWVLDVFGQYSGFETLVVSALKKSESHLFLADEFSQITMYCIIFRKDRARKQCVLNYSYRPCLVVSNGHVVSRRFNLLKTWELVTN